MNILFTICGRAGSKGVKSKNILNFCNIPLPYYSLSAIRLFRKAHGAEYGRIDIVLSTDSEELKELFRKTSDGVYIVDRVDELSGDTVRKIDVIRDAARHAENHFEKEYEIVVDLDITSPLRTLNDLEAVIEKRKNTEIDVDVIYTVTEARRSPYFNMVVKKGKYYDRVLTSEFATRQEAPTLYDMNASIYAYTRDFIYDTNPFFNRADIVLMPDIGILDIDSQRDYELMQVIAQYLFAHDAAYENIWREAGKVHVSAQGVNKIQVD